MDSSTEKLRHSQVFGGGGVRITAVKICQNKNKKVNYVKVLGETLANLTTASRSNFVQTGEIWRNKSHQESIIDVSIINIF